MDTGSYALLMFNSRRSSIQVGALGEVEFKRGYYVYIGSAFGPGGVDARVRRHLRCDKKLHWHIDYLTRLAPVIQINYRKESVRREHEWALALCAQSQFQIPVPGFGSSDCNCVSHLFRTIKRPARNYLPLSVARDVDADLEFPLR
jgi:Uri superfamily endonuclease